MTRIDDLVAKVPSRFHLVHLSAKRAREINGYYAQLGEGLGVYVPPLVATESNKALSVALEEIAQGKVVANYVGASAEITAVDDAVAETDDTPDPDASA
jgi:DNA-directed RNA polymerase subunit omega